MTLRQASVAYTHGTSSNKKTLHKHIYVRFGLPCSYFTHIPVTMQVFKYVFGSVTSTRHTQDALCLNCNILCRASVDIICQKLHLVHSYAHCECSIAIINVNGGLMTRIKQPVAI